MQKERPNKVARNAPCPCGSGKKYKHCCARKLVKKEAIWSKVVLISMVILLIGVVTFAIVLFISVDDTQLGRVWSPEHGHWHTIGEDPSKGISQPPPPGPPPPGKVWSEEHGHWHDVP